LRLELEQANHVIDARRELDAIADALIGEFDPGVVLARAEEWAAAAASTGDGAAALRLQERVDRALAAAERVAAQADGMRRLERSLLPDALLTVPGLQLASRYVPAHGTHDVGGDFYDAVRDGTSISLIVGDVQGKGIDAATLTSLARHTLRTGALMGAGPIELLHQLNRALLYGQEEQLAAGRDQLLRFVTAAVARLDPRDDGTDGFDVTVARAGQPPPLIVRSDGRFETLEPRGVLLGVCEDPRFEEAHASLAVGDTLVLYTDGVIEQRVAAGKAMSEQHLGMLIRNRRGVVDAEAIAQLVEDTVHLVAPQHVRDDVAILVACATRPGAPVSSPADAVGASERAGAGASAPRR
jgi:sigma-B regulation protein RsbU (phosphoserine phosphatase)